MMKVAKLSELPPDSTREVVIGDRTIAVCNSGGTISVLDGTCPHHGGPLGQGNVENGFVICPWHMWEFDCRTGEFDRNPAVKLATYAVEIKGDDICIDLQEPRA